MSIILTADKSGNTVTLYIVRLLALNKKHKSADLRLIRCMQDINSFRRAFVCVCNFFSRTFGANGQLELRCSYQT